VKAAFCLAVLLFLSAEARSQSLTAESLLRDSQNRVSALEQKVDSTNGTLTVSVKFNASILGKKASGDAIYRITVRDGRNVKNELVSPYSFSDSSVASMMNRELRRRQNKPIMGLYLETAFPWARFLPRATKKHEFTATIDSDSAVMFGKKCYLISFELDAEGDSVSAEGDGKIWIDTETLLPVRSYHDFEMKTRRGKAEVISYSDYSALRSGIPVMLRSETQTIPKFLFISVGSIKTVVEQSDFNLE
jgi:outer membrane lipoprotein-sorting protein